MFWNRRKIVHNSWNSHFDMYFFEDSECSIVESFHWNFVFIESSTKTHWIFRNLWNSWIFMVFLHNFNNFSFKFSKFRNDFDIFKISTITWKLSRHHTTKNSLYTNTNKRCFKIKNSQLFFSFFSKFLHNFPFYIRWKRREKGKVFLDHYLLRF